MNKLIMTNFSFIQLNNRIYDIFTIITLTGKIGGPLVRTGTLGCRRMIATILVPEIVLVYFVVYTQ